MSIALKVYRHLAAMEYNAYGHIARIGLGAYYMMPREAIQNECINIHRWAIKKMHTARACEEQVSTIYDSAKTLEHTEIHDYAGQTPDLDSAHGIHSGNGGATSRPS